MRGGGLRDHSGRGRLGRRGRPLRRWRSVGGPTRLRRKFQGLWQGSARPVRIALKRPGPKDRRRNIGAGGNVRNHGQGVVDHGGWRQVSGRLGGDQPGADSLADELEHPRGGPEANLCLSGVDVDIHLFRGDLQEQQHERVYAARHQVLVALGDGFLDQAVADEATIDKDVEGVAVGAMKLGLGHEAVEAQRRPGGLRCPVGTAVPFQAQFVLCDRINPDELLQQLTAEDLVDALSMRGHRSNLKLRAVLVEQIERLVEVGEAVVRHRA